MRLLFVVDGVRDSLAMPLLVSGILGVEIVPDVREWRRLRFHGSTGRIRGYGKKMRYAMTVARVGHHDGVIATVDQDQEKRHVRLNELVATRELVREKNPLDRAAVGEASPHAEAWLFDDPHAVSTALRLTPDVKVPSYKRTKDPKKKLSELQSKSDRSGDDVVDVLADIARELDAKRCKNAKKTGFEDFVAEVHTEFDSFVANAR